MSIGSTANKSDQTIRDVSISLRNGAVLSSKGWVEENPNGSITLHDDRGSKTIYLKDEFSEWRVASAAQKP